jgi:glycine/D-amino acid oxidase-like deaminating enzyme
MSTVAMKQASLPVLSYHTGAGWSTLGFARSPVAARVIALRHIGDPAESLVKKFVFEVHVARRTPLQRELNGGPDGYIFSVGKEVHNG